MRMKILGGIIASRLRPIVPACLLAVFAAACSSAPEIPASEQPLTKESVMLLGRKGMDAGAPIFVRIFKEESELEVWKARSDGRFYHFKTYPICNWSGDLGPKLQLGDKQAPEGFYSISPQQMKPDSQFHLAFNMGYPNAYDRSHGRTGQALMVHGKCKSAGCYAMTDALVEEIYALAREAFRGGQPNFQVHAYPFRMTDEKLARYRKHKWHAFWTTLKQGYDYFEVNRVPPTVAVCERRYVVNVIMPAVMRIQPEGRCPRFQRPMLEPFAPRAEEQQIAIERIVVPGPKVRDLASIAPPPPLDEPAVAANGSPWPAAAMASKAPALTSGSEPIPAGASALGFGQ
ncbi:MAG: L,D-transpeptidase family protein [Hyphomicrobium sp.]